MGSVMLVQSEGRNGDDKRVMMRERGGGLPGVGGDVSPSTVRRATEVRGLSRVILGSSSTSGSTGITTAVDSTSNKREGERVERDCGVSMIITKVVAVVRE